MLMIYAMTKIIVYQDYIHSNAQLYRALAAHFGEDRVYFADAQDILDGILDQNVSAFVMPGGADLYYVEKLNGTGNANIRAYVEQGGTYLGICAGAYYGCREIFWAKDIDGHAICGPRELSFYDGAAHGPVENFIENGDFFKLHNAAVKLILQDGTKATAYYSGGPVFDEPDNTDCVITRYKDLPDAPPAILNCRTGKGRAVLCSPHIETSADALLRGHYTKDGGTERVTAIAATLEQGEAGRHKLWNTVMDLIAPA